jgi:muramidase (phage lysozyme)
MFPGSTFNSTPATGRPLVMIGLRTGLYSLLLAFTACTSLQTTEQNAAKGFNLDVSDSVGFFYFLPKALIKIEGKASTTTAAGYEIIVSRLMVADKRRQFHLKWKNNPLFDDTITTPIAVNSQGLLTSVEFSSTDQSPAILNDLATTTVNVFKILGGGPQGGDKSTPPPQTPKPFSVTFDPLDQAESQAAEALIRKASGAVVQVCGVSGASQSCISDKMGSVGGKVGALLVGSEEAQAEKRGGVVYHPPTAVELRFDLSNTGSSIIHRDTVVVPDPARVACFRFGRSPFVNRTTKLTLTEGMPTNFTLVRPSPMKGFTGMLSTVTGTIAAAVPTIVNVKMNQEIAESAAQKKLLEARTNLATAKKNQITAERALEAVEGAQNGTSAAPGNFNSGGGNILNATPEGEAQTGDKDSKSKKLRIEGTVELPET